MVREILVPVGPKKSGRKSNIVLLPLVPPKVVGQGKRKKNLLGFNLALLLPLFHVRFVVVSGEEGVRHQPTYPSLPPVGHQTDVRSAVSPPKKRRGEEIPFFSRIWELVFIARRRLSSGGLPASSSLVACRLRACPFSRQGGKILYPSRCRTTYCSSRGHHFRPPPFPPRLVFYLPCSIRSSSPRPQTPPCLCPPFPPFPPRRRRKRAPFSPPILRGGPRLDLHLLRTM